VQIATAVASRLTQTNGSRLWPPDSPTRAPSFLAALINANEAQEFVSFDDLAAEARVERKAIDGWNRNLGRSVKAVVRELGFLCTEQDDGTQQLFDYELDDPNNVWKYVVPTTYRATLKEALAAR
jgi:hypothetical protein